MTRRKPIRALAAVVILLASLAAPEAQADEPEPGSPAPTPAPSDPVPDAGWFEEGVAPPETAPATAPSLPETVPAAAPSPPASSPPAPIAEGSAPSRARARALVHHAPVASAVEARELTFSVGLDDPHLVRALLLLHRGPRGAILEVPFGRDQYDYRATIPAEAVRPGLAYAIEVVLLDGTRVAAFASREVMHPVQLLVEGMDEREALLLARLGGRRSVATVSSEYADFGPTRIGDREANDRFWRVEGQYTYRPLRTVAEFSIRGGVVRGSAPRSSGDIEGDVGLNYGAPRVRLRMGDAWHLELEGLASVSDEGFSTGGGSNLLIGDPYGSKLVLGGAFVGLSSDTYFGSRFFTRVDLAVHERVTLSPIIEVTDMPNAERLGVRLLADVAVAFGGGFSASVNGGYQARVAESGGLGLGASASLGF